MDKIPYFNDMLARFEEIFYHELSGCARPKVELIGIDYLQSKKIEGDSAEKVVESCIKEIIAGGLVEDASYSIHGHGVLLKLNISGCIHMPKEIRLKADGLEPYLCPIANMIIDRIIEVAKYETTYTAQIKVHENTGECTVKCAIYENIDKIGQVSDWTVV